MRFITRIFNDVTFVSSVFYFRIPRNEWRDRLEKVRASGFRGIDVYVPWNFHEREEGSFKFDGEADVAAFLDIAAELGLDIIARPGPYICAEWDGGSIPSWLFPKTDIRIRQNDPGWLAYVRKWYEQVVPILRDRQATVGGRIVAVQVENELDFYPCEDPKGYIEHLAQMVRTLGIEVPVTACIGQGDMMGATGGSDQVVPMINIYPSSNRDPNLDQEWARYIQIAEGLGVGPFIMETHRDILTQSRLVAAGFEVISPYLHVSGVHMGPWNAINNWGAKPTFIATDYDFGGMVTADGSLRPLFYENRVLIGVVDAARDIFRSRSDLTRVETNEIATRLGLHSRVVSSPNGRLTFAFNLSESEIRGHVIHEPSGEDIEVTVKPHTYTTWFDDVVWRPEDENSSEETTFRLSSTANLVYRREIGKQLRLVLAADATDAVLKIDGAVQTPEVEGGGSVVKSTATSLAVRIPMHTGWTRIAFANGISILIYSVSTDDAGRLWPVQDEGFLLGPRLVRDTQLVQEPDGINVQVRADFDHRDVAWLSWNGQQRSLRGTPEMDSSPLRKPTNLGWLSIADASLKSTGPTYTSVTPQTMESFGLRFGKVRYTTKTVAPLDGIEIPGGADIVWVYVNGQCEGVYAPAGEAITCQFKRSYDGEVVLDIVVESWGHSNFHDEDKPSIHLGAMRGIWGDVVALPAHRTIGNWNIQAVNDVELSDETPLSVLPSVSVNDGEIKVIRARLPKDIVLPAGAYVKLAGTNIRVDVWLNKSLIGRAWFGPNLQPKVVGGKPDSFWIRPDLWRAEDDNDLVFVIHGTDSSAGTFTDAHLSYEDEHTVARDQSFRFSL